MSANDGYQPIRSYQRIFRPDRRIYQVEGHALPVPGGIPLRWLGYAAATVIAVLGLSARTVVLVVLLAATASFAGWRLGAGRGALLAGSVAAGVTVVLGAVLASLDWPLRLVVLPALVATLGTQATPDGRHAHRFALSWLALQLRAPRRSAGRQLSPGGARTATGARLWIAPDAHTPTLRRARVHGLALVRFARPVAVRRGRRGRIVARPARGAGEAGRSVVVAAGERLEVRP